MMPKSQDDVRQALYLIADEMRGMATIGRHFAGNVYEEERAHRIMALAVEVAALAEGTESGPVRAIFEQEPWQRVSPMVGVDAAVFNAAGELLLIQRRDNAHWAMPGGLAEIGLTFAETAVKELWEEAGLRGRAVRLLGVFDAQRWGSRAKVHLINMVFSVACEGLAPAPGIEALGARFFARHALPQPLHPGHDTRIPVVFERHTGGDAFFDPADAAQMALDNHQRPAAFAPPADDPGPVRRNGHHPPDPPAGLLHLLTRS